MKYTSFILIFVLLSCKSPKYQLEENSKLTLKKGFYKIIPSGMFQGKSTQNVSIILNDFNTEEIILNGVYFQNEFVNYKKVNNPYKITASTVIDKTSKNEIPFKLENNEVVVKYTQKKKPKFVKFRLNKKKNSLDNIPMNTRN